MSLSLATITSCSLWQYSYFSHSKCSPLWNGDIILCLPILKGSFNVTWNDEPKSICQLLLHDCASSNHNDQNLTRGLNCSEVIIRAKVILGDLTTFICSESSDVILCLGWYALLIDRLGHLSPSNSFIKTSRLLVLSE